MYTRFIGTLNEKLLNSDYSLAEARVLYELANRSAPQAKGIGESLGMDTGYLSRLLAKFERDGLLRKTPSEQDGRYADLILTSRGKAAFRKLNALSDEQARVSLEELGPQGSHELIRCMQKIERILTKAEPNPRTYVLRPPRIGDMGWVVQREGAGYAEQFGWDQTFEALVAKIVSNFVRNFEPRLERCWMAEVDGQNVGHVFLVKHPDEAHTAKLRLLFVEPSARGLGLGEVLVRECIAFARTAGYRRIVLWTQSMLLPAIRIYEKSGFRLIREEPHHSFGHNLVGQEWALDLQGNSLTPTRTDC
jgi:DNA-binding MarR family transcriptional regulator/GNAT superfamily N-acetyltransferase